MINWILKSSGISAFLDVLQFVDFIQVRKQKKTLHFGFLKEVTLM